MENQLQPANQLTQAHQSTVLSEKEVGLAKQVYHINQLATFPLNKEAVEDWSRSIAELAPEMTPEQLREVINQYKTGEMVYDRGQGIQNIFEGYRAIFGGRGLVY